MRKRVFRTFWPGQTQTGLLSYRSWQEAWKILVTETTYIILSKQWTTKVLIRLRGCAGWSAPLLFAYEMTHFLMARLNYFPSFTFWHSDNVNGMPLTRGIKNIIILISGKKILGNGELYFQRALLYQILTDIRWKYIEHIRQINQIVQFLEKVLTNRK